MDEQGIDGDLALLVFLFLAGLIPIAADALHARPYGWESVLGMFISGFAAIGFVSRVVQNLRARRIQRRLLK